MAIKSKHPLMSMSEDGLYVRDWSHWLELWEKQGPAEEKLGLLHHGFKVTAHRGGKSTYGDDEIHRVLVYLDIADGWTDSRNFAEEGEDEKYADRLRRLDTVFGSDLRPSQVRRRIAEKAFVVLCREFFPHRLDADGYRYLGLGGMPSWGQLVLNETVRKRLYEFFRLSSDRNLWYFVAPNTGLRHADYGGPDGREKAGVGQHNLTTAKEFVRDMVRFLWNYPRNRAAWNSDEAKRIMEEWPTAIDLLAASEQIEVLLDCGLPDNFQKWGLPRLEELVLSLRMQNPFLLEDREKKPKTIDEAVGGQVEGADVAKILSIRMDAQKKRSELNKAKHARDEAARKLRDLKTR